MAAFFRHLIDAHGVTRALDCACGTGRDLALLHSLGCTATGSDVSPSMLEVARRNLAGRGLALPLVQADYRELPQYFAEPFQAVLCLATAISHMPDEAEVLRAFRSMHAVLAPGGVLVLSQGTADRMWAEQPRFLLARDTPELTRLFVVDYRERGATYNVIDVWHDAHRLETWASECHLVLLQADQDWLLGEAGFEAVDFYGGWALEPYDRAASERLIAVAHKR